MPTTEDRLTMLRSRDDEFTGIDFVQIVDACDQTALRVFFLTDPRTLLAPFEDVGDPTAVDPLLRARIRIYNPRGQAPDIPAAPVPAAVDGIAWLDDEDTGRRVLELRVAEPGTFADYRLRIDDARIDRGFNDVRFSFKVGCESRLDCAVPPRECAPEELVDFPVDYLARDFVSLRNALLDFAAQRYPSWQLPREADVGTMMLEIFAALGDELAYVQERIHRESGFETATERRTLRRKARLVDHEIHDGRMASTVLELTVLPGVIAVEGGSPVWVRTAGETPIAFEIGEGMRDRGVDFPVSDLWNAGNFTPYWLDDDEACLAPFATEMFVRNDPANADNPGGIVFDAVGAALWENRRILLRLVPEDPSQNERLFVVRVVGVDIEDDNGAPLRDELFGIDLARIRWAAEHAPDIPLPLARVQVSGNLVPATAGASRTVVYRLGPLEPGDAEAGVLQAVEREGPLYSNHDASLLRRVDPCVRGIATPPMRPTIWLLSLPGTETDGLAFADREHDLRRTEPETDVYEVAAPAAPPGEQWQFRRTLLIDGADDRSYTLEDGTWRRIVAYPIPGGEHVHRDYALSTGYTVRFGDGEFGRLPADGDLFRIDYRVGAGARANVPAGSIGALAVPGEPASPLAMQVSAVRNPFAVSDGVDPESLDEIKQVAPHAYAAQTFFAVRPEDYARQAETLEFVQRAGASFRWTGSWLSAIATADPIGAHLLSLDQRRRLERLLDCRRQAGRDVIVADPRFVALDLRITLCVARSSFPAHVEIAVREALFGRGGLRPTRGFFHPDNFTFGTPLRRSALEAVLQRVTGVDAVIGIEVRRLGETELEDFEAMVLEVADDEVIRVESDPTKPERGMVELVLEGGA